MIKRIQQRPYWQRVVIFAVLVALILLAILLVTLGVAWLGVNGGPRSTSLAMRDEITVREWVTLPDDDAYPGALTLDPDGNVYTASYISGAVWRITPAGDLSELPNTRDTFGSVTALVWSADGLYVLDRRDPIAAAGKTIWRWRDNAAPERLHDSDEIDRLPYDMTRDPDGSLYVSFVLRGGGSVIVRYPVDGTAETWWTAPEAAIITGLVYEPTQDRIIASDTVGSDLYQIPRADPQGATLLYHNLVDPAPEYDGLALGTDGTLYVAALGLNRVAMFTPGVGMTYLAGAFRGSSRVAYDPVRRRLYVNNWDQRSLLSDQVLFIQIDVRPKLPFALDVIEWK